MSVISIPNSNLFIPTSLGKLTVTHEGHEFFVINSNNSKTIIQRAYLDNGLRGISNTTLQKVLDAGYLQIKQIGTDYGMEFKPRLLGGGPFGAFAAYIGTNIVGGVMVLAGAALAPVGGIGVVLMAAGVSTIAAAPTVLIVALPLPTL